MPTEPVDYLLPKRKVRLKVGFDAELIQVFQGHTDMPTVERKSRVAKIHLNDELEILDNYKLSGGELQLDIRTDWYLWGILDDVYSEAFDVIASCNVSETWTGSTDETVYQRGGDAAQKLEATVGDDNTATTAFASPLDLSGFATTDKFAMFIFIDDAANLNAFKIRLGDADLSDYYYLDNTDLVLATGWNQIWVSKSAFHTTGTPSWAAIAAMDVFIEANGTGGVYTIFDEVRMCELSNYPKRMFDVGIQTIPVAWWAGNTALYEIQTACESEGARFYSSENWELVFENRQHYNLADEHKHSLWLFDFDRMTDFEFPGSETDIINNVIVKLRPRKVVSVAEVIWTYGFSSGIAPAATKTIWASLNDPCPTTAGGIIDPVATTDYLGNTQADGLGTDKTAQLGIVITRFANAVKLDITNNDAGTVYITFLQLQGTPAKESDEVTVTVEDATSIAIYGKRPRGGYIIENKYLADESYAETLADNLIDSYKNPRSYIELKARAIPQMQLGDMITVKDSQTLVNYLMRIIWLKVRLSIDGGMEQEIHCRPVLPRETLTFFQIGVSEIASTDIIAP